MNKQDWTYKKLGDLFDIGSSKRVYESQWKNAGVPFYRAREIVKLSRDGYVDNELFIDEELYKKYANKYGIPKCGDLMVTGVGTLGVCYIVRENDEFYFKDGNILWFKSKEGTNPFYVNYAFKSNYLRQQIENCNGATVGTFTIVRAKNTVIPVPPIEEQERIVAELDLLQGIIEKKKEQLKAYDQLAQSIFYTMFGAPIDNPKGWETKKLGDVCEYAKTRIPSNDISVRNYIGVENLLQNCQGKTIATKVPKDIGLTMFIEGDVLIGNIRPYLKKIWLADCQGGCNGDVLTIRRKAQYVKDIDTFYLLKCLSTDLFFEFAMQYSKGEKMPRGDKKEIMKYELLLPPLSLQQEFAEKVEAIERQKALVQQSIVETQTMFDYTMDKYFG